MIIISLALAFLCFVHDKHPIMVDAVRSSLVDRQRSIYFKYSTLPEM